MKAFILGHATYVEFMTYIYIMECVPGQDVNICPLFILFAITYIIFKIVINLHKLALQKTPVICDRSLV